MTEAPERIWVCRHVGEYGSFYPEAVEAEGEHGGKASPYYAIDPAAKSLDEHTALAIREAALREAAGELYRWGDIYGDNAARSVLALIKVSATQNDKKEDTTNA